MSPRVIIKIQTKARTIFNFSMKDIFIEQIKWQRREKLQPGVAMLPLEDEEAARRGLPQAEMIQAPVRLSEEELADCIIKHLESRYDYKIASFALAVERRTT